jgi:hypothetical protein
MTPEEIAEKLHLHGRWLDGHPDGVRAKFTHALLYHADFTGSRLSEANFTGSLLSNANFKGAVLAHADFTGSRLSNANFKGAVLAHADFTGSRLSNANFKGAVLTGAIGLICLPVGDPRGYRPVAVRHGDGWMIAAGCRWFTVAQALEHWGSPDYPDRALGDQYVAAVKGL